MVSRLWKEWVYDSMHLPIKWKTHPHRVFKCGARIVLALLGSIVPVGLVLIQSNVLTKLDDGAMKVGWVFWTTVIVFCAVWLGAILGAAASEEKTHMKYMFLGSVAPANLTILYLLIQNPS